MCGELVAQLGGRAVCELAPERHVSRTDPEDLGQLLPRAHVEAGDEMDEAVVEKFVADVGCEAD